MRQVGPTFVVMLLCVGCGHARPSTQARTYVISDSISGIGSALGVGGAGHDCDKEHIECFDRCWNAPRPPYPHRHSDEWYYEYCTRTCREEYEECLKEMAKAGQEQTKGRPTLKFASIDKALDWLRSHKSEITIGTVVIVAGTAFVVATGGAGALILAPLAL